MVTLGIKRLDVRPPRAACSSGRTGTPAATETPHHPAPGAEQEHGGPVAWRREEGQRAPESVGRGGGPLPEAGAWADHAMMGKRWHCRATGAVPCTFVHVAPPLPGAQDAHPLSATLARSHEWLRKVGMGENQRRG